MRVPCLFSMVRWVAAGVLTVQLGLPVEAMAQAAQQQGAGSMGGQMAPASGAGDGGQTAGLKARSDGDQGAVDRIPQDQKYLLILDRFTYGPRPGELQKLREMGMQAWFDEQLHPEKIHDEVLEAKLANYPAMQMPLGKLMEMYPSNALIRQQMSGRAGVPGGAAEKAIYADQEARYKEQQKAQKAGKDGAGVSAAEVSSLAVTPADLLAMPPDKRFKALCKLTLPQLGALRKSMTPEQRQGLVEGFTPEQVEALAAFHGPRNVVEAEEIQVKLLRDAVSERQLQEVMVDFWLNHFNVYVRKSQDAPYYIAAYERDAIRPNALGSFENLLLATATSPAMLNYLDNSSSVGPHSEFATGYFGAGGRRVQAAQKGQAGLNENYAREVMELHTVGVGGGYSQKDVTELAKVFTGWTVGRRPGQDVQATAQYDPTKHEPGTKVVMGRTFKENGQMEGVQALKMLASTPQCARFISTKLAVRFVSDDPPPAMVDRMTQVFLESHGNIRQVLVAMVNSPEFFTAATYRAKLKTPQEFVVSAVRASGAEVESTAGMQQAIADLGMPVYGMQTPNGYSMKAEAWNSTSQLVSRMNFALALATNRVAGVRTDLGALMEKGVAGKLAAGEMSAEQKTRVLEAVLLHDPVSDKTQRLILAQVKTDTTQQAQELRQVTTVNGRQDPLRAAVGGPAKPQDVAGMDTQASLAAGLILGSPEFQRR